MKKIKEINLKELKKYSLRLAQKIKDEGFVPEHILYVERAGLFIGYEIADFFQCGISGISATRSGGNLKSKVKKILQLLPRFLTHFLRRIELGSNLHGVKKDRNVSVEGKFPPRGKTMLLVDDAIDTGYSIEAIISFLEQAGHDLTNIKIAVLTTTSNSTIRTADFSFFDQVHCAFPWSYDSREYDNAWKHYALLKNKMYPHAGNNEQQQ